MVFSKFLWVFRIGLFVSSNTYKGKAAYFRISPDPAKAESHWELLLIVFISAFIIISNLLAFKFIYNAPIKTYV